MNNITRRSVLIAAVCCLIIAVTLSGCFFEREYLDDIHIPLETQEGEIIIREWQFLLGSGAEIYYKVYGKEVLLGQLPGGDDGFCPFKEGLYSVAVEDNKLTIEWDGYPSISRPVDKETFEIPAASTVKQSIQRQRLVIAMIALVCISIPVVIIPVVIVIVRKRKKSR